MARFLTEAQVAALLPMADAVAALEEAFRALAGGTAHVLPRQRVHVPSGVLQVMPAGIAGAALGLKAYATCRGGTRFYVLLFDQEQGKLQALFQADRLGRIRTGAASGVATRYLAREEARTVGIIGAGTQALSQVAAVCAVRPIERVRCYSRSPERREQFARALREELGGEVEAAAEARAAVEGADVLITITSAREPVLDGAWLRPGVHVNAAGVNQASRRELDGTAVQRADRVVVDLLPQAQQECGDLIAAAQEGVFRWEQAEELAPVVAGTVPGRQTAEQITLFESQGIALEDVAVASLVYRRAVEQGVGVELEV